MASATAAQSSLPRDRKNSTGARSRLGTLGTITRRLHRPDEEVKQLEKEGQKAITLSEKPVVEDEYATYSNKVMLRPKAMEAPEVKELVAKLLDWVNEVLAERRILIRDFFEDFADGQMLSELMEELTGNPMVGDGNVALSEFQRKTKLQRVLDFVNETLSVDGSEAQWSAEHIYSGNPVATLHLLVALAHFYHCPYTLPSNVRLRVLHVERLEERMVHREKIEQITGDEVNPSGSNGSTTPDQDIFDRLLIQAPHKLDDVKNALLQFVNTYLKQLGVQLESVDGQFHDGVYLIFLVALAEGFCLPLCDYHVTPVSRDQKLHNVGLAFSLMRDFNVMLPGHVTPDQILRKELKPTLRVLYALHQKYKNVK